MSTYAIGDIQGCFEPFMRLLKKIQFDPKQDFLWLTGDLVNRGPQSLETIRFIKALGNKVHCVLGNHDLTLLAVAYGVLPFNPVQHTFGDILAASDKTVLLNWLKQLPLMHYDARLGYAMVHAGIYPSWDLQLALALAKEVENHLQGSNAQMFFSKMFGNQPEQWDPKLEGYDRLRFITNAFTRLRFCTAEGKMEFSSKKSTHLSPMQYLPWFSVPHRAAGDLKIIFGHWATLEGRSSTPGIFALDTGCVWGHCLSAMRLEDGQKFQESCAEPTM